ncbi:hypothetical protein ACF068_26015 [Streptomyces sp. NPDC016309]|uniref:hypothetical protein n=1 Tax=Streptomyces sp. NPDC016309 TaxID=3364965 RepID=UPI003702EC85
MTTTDTTQHPDVAEISDLTEGLLPPSRTADVRAHLDDCELCADVLSSLEEIRGLLGTLPGPSRMPADIAGRIDAALAAEALLNATAPSDATGDVSRETAPAPLTSEPVRADRPAGRPSAATGPGRARPVRRRRRTAVLSAVFGVAAMGVSVLLFQAVQSEDDPAGSKTTDSAVSAPQEGTFSGTAVEDRVEALLAAEEHTKQPRSDKRQPPSVDSPSTMAADDAVAVPSCVQAGTGRSDQPLAAQPGTYEGKQAYLVVLPHSTDPSKVQAYVVDASCAATPSSAKADLLLTHAYPRP